APDFPISNPPDFRFLAETITTLHRRPALGRLQCCFQGPRCRGRLMREFEPSQPRRLAINPLCARRAADSVNRLGRPAPSIAFFSGTMRFWVKELPAFGGFGDICFETGHLQCASERFRLD